MSFYVQSIVTPLHCSCSICVTRQRQFESLSLQRRNHHNSESTPDNLMKPMIFAWLIQLQPTQSLLFVFHLKNPPYIKQAVKHLYWYIYWQIQGHKGTFKKFWLMLMGVISSSKHNYLCINNNKCRCEKILLSFQIQIFPPILFRGKLVEDLQQNSRKNGGKTKRSGKRQQCVVS